MPGVFPFSNKSFDQDGTCPIHQHNFGQFVAAAAMKSLPSDVKIERTGLILRRIFMTPPIGLDFWNRIINLCLQKDDFAAIIWEAFDRDTPMNSHDHGQFYQIGNCQMRWKYWKSGIVLDLNHQTILYINSVRTDDFTDPVEESVISETFLKARRFKFFDEEDKFIPLQDICSEVFEVVVVDVNIEAKEGGGTGRVLPISAKLLTKALEMIDGVLRGYSNDFSEDGIYSLSRLFHITPCPVCFGDADNRPKDVIPKLRCTSDLRRPRLGSVARQAFQSFQNRRSQDSCDGGRNIVVFSLDQCIEAITNGVDFIECPVHGVLKLDYLTPDIVSQDHSLYIYFIKICTIAHTCSCMYFFVSFQDFNDLSNLKLNISQLTNRPGDDGTPVGQGCFGKVYHKLLNVRNEKLKH